MATLLQSTTIGGHAAIHAGNIGAQSVNYANSAGSVAWTNVSGRPTALSQFTNDLGNYGGWITSSALANYLTTSQVTTSMISGLNNMLGVTSLPYSVDITVGGDADKFYAVQFWGGDQDVWRRIIIKRGYSEPAPWDPIGTGVHHGGLLLDWEGNFGGWGGAEYADRLRVFNESYTNVCADMFIWSHSMGYVFMLRGGGALYHLHSDQAINGYYQAGSPDILYSSSTLSYDDNWSGTNVYDVYAPAPLGLGAVNSTRIDGLRTKKQSLLDNRYLRQGIDISGIGNITSTNSYATNFFASNAFYLNGASYYLNSTNGGIYTNARFESATLLVAPGGNSSQWNSAFGWGNHAAAGYVPQSRTLTINGVAQDLTANRSWTISSTDNTKLPLAGGIMSGRLTLKSISGVEQTVPNDFGAYLHLGSWGVGRTDASVVLVNTAYRADYADSLFDMNISRFTNNSGYITGYTETDTLQSVTNRGASTSAQVSFTKTDDHAISVGTIRGRAVGSQTGEFIQLYERVNIGGPNGWGAANTAAPSYGLSVYGGANIGYGNSASLFAYAYRGNSNVSGTGEASYHPAGIYSTGTNWLYGTMYVNNNHINDVGYLGVGQSVNTNYRIITSGDYYANAGGNFWAEGRFKQYRGSGTWHDVIDSGNIGSQSVATATRTSGNSGYGHAGTGMWPFFNWGGNNGGGSAPNDGSYTTGISVGSHPNDQAYGFQIANNMWNTGLWTRNYNSGFGSWIRIIDSDIIGSQSVAYATNSGNSATTSQRQFDYIYRSSYLESAGAVYGTIFYDNNDRGYYCDPNSTSRLNAIVYDNLYFAGDQTYGFLGRNVYADTVNGRGSDPLELNYYDGGAVKIGSGTNGSKALYAGSLYDDGSRVAISRGEGRQYVEYSRYVYNNGAYSGSGWIEPSDLGVRYASNANYATSAGSASSASYARYLPTYYVGGQQTNPQVYFNNGIGFNVAMTGAWSVWSDTLWINGYSGGDVPWMCALHFLRNSEPRMAISAQRFDSTGYGGYYEVITAYNIASQTVSTANNLTGFDKTNPSFGAVYANNWFRAYGDTGLYQQDYGGHFRRNVSSSHGTWEIFGYAKGGYNGLLIKDDAGYINNYMHEGGNGGLYLENQSGRWAWYWHRGNRSLGLADSTTSSSYAVYVSGSLYATGDIVAYSDRRKKTDIVTIEDALEKVKSMRGVFYTKIDESEKGRQVGVIAQEMNEVLPEAVIYAADVDEYGVKYGNIVGVLIEAIKEQQKEIDELKAKLN